MYLFDLYFHVMYLNNSSEYMKKHCNEYCIKHNRITPSKKKRKIIQNT